VTAVFKQFAKVDKILDFLYFPQKKQLFEKNTLGIAALEIFWNVRPFCCTTSFHFIYNPAVWLLRNQHQ
jgi:hypothetical protein